MKNNMSFRKDDFEINMRENRDIQTYRMKLHGMFPELQEDYNVSYIVLFASYVRDEENQKRDSDVLVEFSKTPTIFKFVNLENYLSDSLGIKMDLIMKNSLKPNIGKFILNYLSIFNPKISFVQ